MMRLMMLTYTQYGLILEKLVYFFGKQTQIIPDDLKIRNAEVKVTNNTVMLKFNNKREINNQYNIRQIKLICEFQANLLYKKATMSCKLTVQLYLISYCTGSS
jgi:hypothetical protein